MTETAIVPFRVADLLDVNKLGEESILLAQVLAHIAEQLILQEVPDFLQSYNGAEREPIVLQRALKLQQTLKAAAVISMDAAGDRLAEELLVKGTYHPDLRSETQELIDEMVSRGERGRQGQGRFFVDHIFPQARAYGIDLNEWLSKSSRFKLYEMTPEFRDLLQEPLISDVERREQFMNFVEISTYTLSEIREIKQEFGPVPFKVYEYDTDDPEGGVEWNIPFMTHDTKVWAIRKLQPYCRVSQRVDNDLRSPG